MAMKLSKQHTMCGSAHVGETYWLVLRCEGNGTSAPDGAEPASVTWARSGAGQYTADIPDNVKPRRVLWGKGTVEETGMKDTQVNFCGYDAATGVVTIEVGTNSAGTISLADLTDKTIVVALLCSDNPVNDA